jgi:hypothetical protein
MVDSCNGALQVIVERASNARKDISDIDKQKYATPRSGVHSTVQQHVSEVHGVLTTKS